MLGKGQIYSLDFIIAAGLLVLAIGLCLGIYESSTYQAKEAREKSELNAIALTAGSILLGESRCPLDTTAPVGNQAPPAFSASGYNAYGCSGKTPMDAMTKEKIMVPSNFKCRAVLKTGTTETLTTAANGCRDDPAAGAAPMDISSMERKFLVPKAALTKANYEKCIENSGCNLSSIYDEYILTFMVWRA
ncbi:Uncharacterised protein [uncultured archaeon]|nr:Uncharacterised protein [uncultured archaeon]